MSHHRKLGFMASIGFAQQSPEEVLKVLSKLGYTGVEWTLSHFNPRTKSLNELKDLITMTGDFGMEVSEVTIQQDVVSLDQAIRRDRIEFAEECIRAAAQTGVKILNFFTGPAQWDPLAPKLGTDITQGEAWDLVIDAFDRFVPLAQECKVCIAVECVFGMTCRDYYTTRPLIDHYNSEYLGVNMDPSHDTLLRNDIPWIVKQWGNKIKHVHLKDAIGVPGKSDDTFTFPLLGEGLIDWKAFTTALDDIGYDGYMSVEFESFRYLATVLKGDAEEAARISYEAVKRLM